MTLVEPSLIYVFGSLCKSSLMEGACLLTMSPRCSARGTVDTQDAIYK